MKLIVTSIFALMISMVGLSQTIVDWSADYKIQLSDFQSAESEINEELNTYSIYSGSAVSFSFQMSSYEFMFTKNFNSKVKCTFSKNLAVLVAPDSTVAEQLVRFAQFDFDLNELYSRKFRKELYEQKGTFSNASFFQPIYNESQEEMVRINAQVSKKTELGKNADLLKKEHMIILEQIDELSNFCKDCKPPKKKKK